MTPKTLAKVLVNPFFIGAAFQNLPIPARMGKGTTTTNYEERRFFAQMTQEGTISEKDFEAEELELYETVTTNILDMYGGVEFIEATATPIEDLGNAFASSVRSWFPFQQEEIPIAVWLGNAQIENDTISYCQEKGVLSYLFDVLDIVHESFHNLQTVTCYPEEDPESEETWLTTAVQIGGEISDILSAYDNYTRRIISSVPWPERSQFRLSFEIV